MEHQKPIRPLVLAFWTPPIVRPQAMLIGKMLPEWLRQGIAPVLVFYEESGAWDIDIPKHAIARFEPKGIWKFPYLNFIAQFVYWKRTANEIKSLIAQYDINVIFSFANPMESNIIGAMLARKTGIPYVAHFSDPWQSQMRTHSLAGSLKVNFLEQFVVNAANHVTTPDEAMEEYISEKYSPKIREKFSVVNHCYDPNEYPQGGVRPQELDGKFIISHIGSFYKQRTPEMLLLAVSELLKSHPELRSRTILQFIGGISIYGGFSKVMLDDLIDQYALRDIVQIFPPVEYHESLQCMKMADVLVVIDMAVSYFVAMKLIDYAGANKSIVTIASPGSSNARMTNRLGYSVFDFGQGHMLADHLFALMTGQLVQHADAAYRETFHVQKTTEEYGRIFRSLLSVSLAKE